MTRKIQPDMINAKDFRVDELRKMAFEDSDRMPRELAVALLARKDYKAKLEDLRRLVQDESAPVKVRHAAALGLGRIASPQSVEVLHTLKTSSRFVQRGVEQALNEAALQAADIEPPGAGKPASRSAVRRAAAFRGHLAAYRRGEEGGALPYPAKKRLLSLGRKAAETVPVQSVTKQEARQAVRDLQKLDPDMTLRTEKASRLRCGGRDLMLLLSAESGDPGSLNRYLDRKAAPGVLAVRFGVETQAWSPRYHLLTQPARRRNQIQVMLVTTKGRVAFAGLAEVQGERAEFHLQAVDSPGMAAAAIEGEFEGGEVRLTKVQSALRAQARLVPKERGR